MTTYGDRDGPTQSGAFRRDARSGPVPAVAQLRSDGEMQDPDRTGAFPHGDVCYACGRRRPAGGLVELLPTDPLRARMTVCRPSVNTGCLRLAGTVDEFLIRLLDPAEARVFDANRPTW